MRLTDEQLVQALHENRRQVERDVTYVSPYGTRKEQVRLTEPVTVVRGKFCPANHGCKQMGVALLGGETVMVFRHKDGGTVIWASEV